MASTADCFIQNLKMDQYPTISSVLLDFGLNNPSNFDEYETNQFIFYRVYQHGLKSGVITEDEIRKAVGNGPELTKLVQRIDPSIVIKTDYDEFGPP